MYIRFNEFHAQNARCFGTTRNAYLLNHAQAERLLSGEEVQQRTAVRLAQQSGTLSRNDRFAPACLR